MKTVIIYASVHHGNTKKLVERIAEKCGVQVSYTESGRGGFIIDSSGSVYKSVNDIFMKNIYDTKEKSDSNGGMTLEEARENYKNYGACDKKFIDKVRKPNKDEIE